MNTDEQIQAITTIDKNLAVNAGAGTGKTKVLTERYIYILEHGDLEENKEVESIVAITFTKKATQEMKERIRDEIKKRFNLDKKWRRFYNDLEKANISTIHSFCGNILRDNPLKANIDPMFTVLDSSEGDLMLEDTIVNILLNGMEKDQNIFNLVKLFKWDDLSNITEELKSIYYKVRTVGYTFEHVKDMTLSFINNIQEADEYDIDKIRDIFINLIDKSRKNSKLGKLSSDEIWLKFKEKKYCEEDLIPILEYLYDNIGTNSKEKDTVDNLKSAIDKVLLIKEKRNLWIYETFLELLIKIDEEYRKRKDEKGALDYDDLQILVLKLLDDDEVREEYQNRYRYIMVDEFQDTNELQRKIFYKLCSRENTLDRNNLFVVGDPKQSIYGFRGADLEVFYEVVEDIERISNQKTISLDKNFRSVDTIISFINNLFSNLMGNRYNSLQFHHKSKNKIDVEILEKKDLEIPESVKRGDYETYFESRLIAGRIKELVEEGNFDYGDFCLLFRASTDDYIYEDALREYGIPYYNLGGKGLFEAQEIKDLINGLKSISNRYDTIATVGFLRSPMIGLSDRTLYWLLKYKKSNLIETFNEDIPYIEVEEKQKIEKAKEILSELLIKKDVYRVSRILRELIQKTYYLDTLMLNPSGMQLISNVYKFMDICNDFDKNLIGSLEDFIDYIENMKNSGDAEKSQSKIHTEDANVVKMMTIHKSKGLQFPVVIIPQMSRKPNIDRSFAVFDKKIGIGLKLPEGKSPLHESIKNGINDMEDEENKRILYVAMTRAEKMLILGNQGKNDGFKKMIEGLYDLNSVKYIDKVNANMGSKEKVKIIEDELFKVKSFNGDKFPLLQTIPGYSSKKFLSFNATQFLDFNECKRKFFMIYYRKLPLDIVKSSFKEINNTQRALDGITKGNIVHKFCQHYRFKMDVKNLLSQIVISFGFKFDKDIEEELMPYIENYLKCYREDFNEFYSEKEFYLNVEEAYVHGIIDRINVKEGKCEILDFKTNKVIDKAKLKEKYAPQIQLYANAIKRITNFKVEKAYILFLETGDMEEIDVSEESLNENMNNVKEFINFVNSKSLIEDYVKSTKCENICEYSVMCNYIDIN